jgi:hypothetical protein
MGSAKNESDLPGKQPKQFSTEEQIAQPSEQGSHKPS